MRKAFVPCLLALTTCGPAPGQQGYLLLSSQARQAGLLIETRGIQLAPVLPFGLPVGEPAALLGPHSRTDLVVTAGEVLVVSDAEGQLKHLRLDREVRSDRLLLQGEPSAIAELARTLEAQQVPSGQGTELAAVDLLEHTGFLEVPAGVVGAELVAAAGQQAAPPAVALPRPRWILPATKVELATARPASLAQLVGIYQAGPDRLVLTAGGTFQWSEGCPDQPRTGSYRLEAGRLVLSHPGSEPLSFRIDDGGALVSPRGRSLQPTPGVGPMKRRQFLAGTALSAAALSWPSWLRSAFGQGDPGCVHGPSPAGGGAAGGSIFQAYQRAQKAAKPLLVLVIPDLDLWKDERGHRFGELLNHGTDEQLAPLPLAEVVCATMEQVRQLVPDAPQKEPYVLRVDTDAVPAQVHGFDFGDPPPEKDPPHPSGAEPEVWKAHFEALQKAESKYMDLRIAEVAGAIRSAVLGSGAPPAGWKGRTAALAVEVRAQLVKAPVQGSRWANTRGCGTTVEGESDSLVMGCGMGHLPEKSSRFLYFFAKTPGERYREERAKAGR